MSALTQEDAREFDRRAMSAITREEAREFDRSAIEEIGVPSVCLMENAGRQTADVACGMLSGGGRALVLCGTGNNGGDGFVAARHLLLRGIPVAVVLLGCEEKLTPDALTNYNAALKCGIDVRIASSIEDAGGRALFSGAAVVLDCLLGTGISGEVRGPHAGAIEALNDSGVPVLGVDIPSGLDCNTGEILGVCVKAKRTVTFIAPKVGFSLASGPAMCGEVIVADIGVPFF